MNDDTSNPHLAAESQPMRRPRIVCLCGSTKFMAEYERANRDETLAGHIVVTVGVDLQERDKDVLTGKSKTEEDEIKARLDALHLFKIDLADEIYVLNINGYIGKSTQREIAYAKFKGRPVRYSSPPAAKPEARRANSAEGPKLSRKEALALALASDGKGRINKEFLSIGTDTLGVGTRGYGTSGLVGRGFLVVNTVQPQEGTGGRPRREYHITDAGRAALALAGDINQLREAVLADEARAAEARRRRET